VHRIVGEIALKSFVPDTEKAKSTLTTHSLSHVSSKQSPGRCAAMSRRGFGAIEGGCNKLASCYLRSTADSPRASICSI
jgi:hypothetical protein